MIDPNIMFASNIPAITSILAGNISKITNMKSAAIKKLVIVADRARYSI